MGLDIHHAIVVTGWHEQGIIEAHAEAERAGLCVSGIVPGVVNGYTSFLIAPDGSKDGWADSDAHNDKRAAFKAWLRENVARLHWPDFVEIAFGEIDIGRGAAVRDHSWQSRPTTEARPDA